MKKYVTNPWIVAPVCMVLFAVMYNNASNGFMRFCSYIPLLVVLGIFGKAVYNAYFKKS